MHVQLSAELELLIGERISSGLYETRAEVVREALRMFFRAEAIREASLARFAAPAQGSSGQGDAQALHRPRGARLHRFLRSRASARRAVGVPAMRPDVREEEAEAAPDRKLSNGRATPSEAGHATLGFSVRPPAV